MNKFLLNCLIGIVLLVNGCLSNLNQNYASTKAFKKTFDSAKPYSDLTSAFYSVKGLQLLGQNVADASLCNFIKTKLDQKSIESVYFAVLLAEAGGNCALPTKDYQQTINDAVNSLNVADLYYYAELATKLKQPIDAAKLLKSLNEGLKKDNSILNQAYSLHIASLLSENDAKKFYANIDDVLEQADEVDSVSLQYDGGVGTTSFVLEGIFKLADKFKKWPVKFDQEKLKKFTNYLISKRYTTNPKSAYYLLVITTRLSSNKYGIPVVLTQLTPASVTKDKPNFLVSVTNILGGAIKDAQFTVELQSSNNQQSGGAAIFKDKRPFTSKSSDGTTYELKLFEPTVAAGFYTLVVNVQPKGGDKRFFVLSNSFTVKFSNEIDIVDLELGVADRDQSSPKLQKLDGKNKLKEQLEGDQSSKIYVKFGVKEKTKGSFIEVNQAFVRLTEKVSGRDIVFIAEFDATTKRYSCDVDLSTNAKNFNSLNGLYSIELIVSDTLVNTPKQIELANVNLRFLDGITADRLETKGKLYKAKAEIKHIFRPDEPRASKMLSTVFSVICALPPVLLIIMWFNLGFNLSNFKFSLSGIVFHLSLAAIFGLFYCYWCYLNMFETLRYLAVLSLVAFFSGKRLLSSLAAKPKEKTN